jgi:uncharacterized protein (TIGR02246 family)
MAREFSNMQRFIFMGLAALGSIAFTVSNPWVGGIVPFGMAQAAPLDRKVVSDKSLLTDGPSRLNGQEKQGSNEDILAAARAYMAALQSGDGQAIAASWTAHGVYVDSSGQSFAARELAIQEFSQPEDNANQTSRIDGSHELSKPGTIHWVTANVALERGTSLQPGAESGEPVAIQYLAVWVQQDNRWLLNFLQETTGLQESLGQRNSTSGNLEELAWMVGQWSTQGKGPVAQLTVKWSEDRKYLVQEFKVNRSGQKELRGEQRIAWDPQRKTIRSWIFRADGGFSESSWSREGDTWIVKIQGAYADGAKSSIINLWAPEGPDRCWFKSLRLPEDANSADPMEQDEVILQFQRTTSGS